MPVKPVFPKAIPSNDILAQDIGAVSGSSPLANYYTINDAVLDKWHSAILRSGTVRGIFFVASIVLEQ